jgi:D-galactarolactone cycloisomerase
MRGLRTRCGSTDQEGLIELCAALNLPIHVGEFLYSIADFGEYIKRDALDVVRLIADNVGGISGSMRVGLLADAHGMECTPHNWGNTGDMALHFHVELALPNSYWFEMPFPAEYADRPFYKDKFRIDADGYVHAPTAPRPWLSSRHGRIGQHDQTNRPLIDS